MKKRLFVFYFIFLILFLLSGCSSVEEMDYEEMENAIVENDPIYLYFNSAPDEISVEKELTENNKEIWIKTSTEYDDFTCKLRSNGMPVPLLRNGYSIFNGTKYR